MLIDVHAHHSPKRYTDAMLRLTGAERPRGWVALPHTDAPDQLARRLELMDQAGVQMQVLSHGIMAPYAQKVDAAVEAARAINDGYADVTRRYPDRLAAYVSLPLPHVEASLVEMRRGSTSSACGVWQ